MSQEIEHKNGGRHRGDAQQQLSPSEGSFESQPSAYAKRWCITVFRYDDEYISRFDELFLGKTISKCAVQEEKCQTTGRTHLQCFVSFVERKRIKQLRKLFGDTIHAEKAKGSDADNLRYCSKADTATGRHSISLGDFVCGGQGRRSDLDRLALLVQEGKSIGDIACQETGAFIRYSRGIKEAIQYMPYDRRNFISVVVIWGPTGTGKSQFVRDLAQKNNLSIFAKDLGKGNVWFDGYLHQDILLLDDFDSEDVRFRDILRWMDKYCEFSVQIKGSFTKPNWSYVFITTNHDPTTWYNTMLPDDRAPMYRRIHRVLHCGPKTFAGETYKEFIDDPSLFGQTLMWDEKE